MKHKFQAQPLTVNKLSLIKYLSEFYTSICFAFFCHAFKLFFNTACIEICFKERIFKSFRLKKIRL
jgi:hypothetical protein